MADLSILKWICKLLEFALFSVPSRAVLPLKSAWVCDFVEGGVGGALTSGAPDLAVRKIHGVRLEQNTRGICAALAGGFPLSDALANDALGERSRAGK